MSTKQEDLKRWGFIVGARDPRLNRAFVGAFMVAEWYEDSETPTDDGSNGPWCIVGDNLDALIETAHNVWADEYEPLLHGVAKKQEKQNG